MMLIFIVARFQKYSRKVNNKDWPADTEKMLPVQAFAAEGTKEFRFHSVGALAQFVGGYFRSRF
ncbi:MAG TPA: hypothetical protein VGR78_01075 [Verrucomicrobiae bacterium]|jgi:hypothetical protein|nr:hypothetical protein [Verrucomicrobiae bacterium]